LHCPQAGQAVTFSLRRDKGTALHCFLDQTSNRNGILWAYFHPIEADGQAVKTPGGGIVLTRFKINLIQKYTILL
jgi:hypothetical protein